MKKIGILLVVILLFSNCKKDSTQLEQNNDMEIHLVNRYKSNNVEFSTNDTLVTLRKVSNFLYIEQIFENPSDSIYVSSYIYDWANGKIDTFKVCPKFCSLFYKDTGIYVVTQTLLLNNNSKIIDSFYVEVRHYYFVPEDAVKPSSGIDIKTPPDNFHAVIAWFQAVTLKPNVSNDGYLIIDYVKLIEIKPDSTENVIYTENYDGENRGMTINEAGLYKRFPSWFADDSHTELSNAQIQNGFLYIYVGQTPDKIAHWWIPRQICKANCRYEIEVKYKVVGDIALQTGVDFWRELDSPWNGYNVNNMESWHGKWWSYTYNHFRTCRPRFNDVFNGLCRCFFEF